VGAAEAGGPRRRRLLALVAALVVPPLLVRGCLLDSYVIESESMAPTLRGGGPEPDHLLVLRRSADTTTPQRFDVVVLDGAVDPELPREIGSVLKRIGGLPGEYVAVSGGDLYAGPLTPPPLVRKADALIAALLVTVHAGRGLSEPWAWAGPGECEALASGGTRVTAGSTPGQALYGALVEDWPSGGEPVADTALEVVVGEGDAVLELALREGADVFRARLADAARGGATLWHNLGGEVVAERRDFGGLVPGQRVIGSSVTVKVVDRHGIRTALAAIVYDLDTIDEDLRVDGVGRVVDQHHVHVDRRACAEALECQRERLHGRAAAAGEHQRLVSVGRVDRAGVVRGRQELADRRARRAIAVNARDARATSEVGG
jgi:signal peptidase I